MSISIYYNPLETACKSKTGAIQQGEILQLNIFLLEDGKKVTPWIGDREFKAKIPDLKECMAPTQNAYLRLNHDGEVCDLYPMQKTDYGWTIAFKINEVGLYYYSFYIENEGNISCGYMELGCLTDIAQGFMLTVHSKQYKTPDWFKGGVMYQIFPDRFCRVGDMSDIEGRIKREDWGGTPSYRPNEKGKILNNDFFGGNFKGIQSKLPYLHSLGVTTIYLNPIFEAASNHRYDTSDYKKIDPYLGTEEDFANFVKEAKLSGISVILDGVFNHTGDDSVYFNKYGHYPSVGAYQSKSSPYASWYSFEYFPNKYTSWWGIDILPEINENSKEYQEFIFGEKGVLKKWLGFGIGGYRLDVADELPDFFLKKLRKSVKQNDPNALIIGEVWEDASNKIAYSKRREYLQGEELDSVMNYPLKDAIIMYMQTENAMQLLQTVRSLIDHYPKQTVDCLMNILGTHDTPRILTVLGGVQCSNKDEMASAAAYMSHEDRSKALEKLKMSALLQYTLPGVPCLYYGDENASEGHIDPFCRRCFNWENMNEELIAYYAKLGTIRKENYEIFKDGTFKALTVDHGFILYKRQNVKNERIYVYVNNSSKIHLMKLQGNYKDCLTEQTLQKDFLVKPYSYGIFKEI